MPPMNSSSSDSFWRTLDELADTPAFRERLHNEFPSQIEAITDPVARRAFLKLMGASIALAGIGACTRQPAEKIVPYVRQPEDLVPGKPLFFATAMPLGGVATGLRERCLAIGANDFLAKPFNSAQLMTRVSLLINVATRKQTALLAHVNVEGDGPAVEPFVARIVNLSTTGLLLEADVKLTPGRPITVKFFVPGNTTQVTATATVARRADAAGGVRWGARFTTLDITARRIIRDYVGAS